MKVLHQRILDLRVVVGAAVDSGAGSMVKVLLTTLDYDHLVIVPKSVGDFRQEAKSRTNVNLLIERLSQVSKQESCAAASRFGVCPHRCFCVGLCPDRRTMMQKHSANLVYVVGRRACRV